MCQKQATLDEEENIEEVDQKPEQGSATITRESGCHQRESRAKQDRDHPAVMVTESDHQHQHQALQCAPFGKMTQAPA